MKTLSVMLASKPKETIEKWIQARLEGTGAEYEIDGGVINVTKGSVRLLATDTHIPYPIGEVAGSFYCSNQMVSIENSPKGCRRFYCEENPDLNDFSNLDVDCMELDASKTGFNSFEGMTIKAKRLYLDETDLTSLHNIHKHVKYCSTLNVSGIKDSVLGLFFIPGLKSVATSWHTKKEDLAWAEVVNRHIRKGKMGLSAAVKEFVKLGLNDYAKF